MLESITQPKKKKKPIWKYPCVIAELKKHKQG